MNDLPSNRFREVRSDEKRASVCKLLQRFEAKYIACCLVIISYLCYTQYAQKMWGFAPTDSFLHAGMFHLLHKAITRQLSRDWACKMNIKMRGLLRTVSVAAVLAAAACGSSATASGPADYVGQETISGALTYPASAQVMTVFIHARGLFATTGTVLLGGHDQPRGVLDLVLGEIAVVHPKGTTTMHLTPSDCSVVSVTKDHYVISGGTDRFDGIYGNGIAVVTFRWRVRLSFIYRGSRLLRYMLIFNNIFAIIIS